MRDLCRRIAIATRHRISESTAAEIRRDVLARIAQERERERSRERVGEQEQERERAAAAQLEG